MLLCLLSRLVAAVVGVVQTLLDRRVSLLVKVSHGASVVINAVAHLHFPLAGFKRSRLEAILSLMSVPAKDTKHCCIADVTVSATCSVRLFVPKNIPPNEKLTLLLFVHGGGHVMLHNSFKGHHELCEQFAAKGPMVVASVEYRLAPEHQFPLGIVDCHAALLWCASSGHPLLEACGEPGQRRICVGGDSAGGNISAVLSLLARDGLDGDLNPAPKVPIARALLIYPHFHMENTPSRKEHADAYIIPKPVMDFFLAAYLGDRVAEIANDFRLACHKHPSHAGLPPTTIIVATLDPLRDEGKIYGELLKKSGVECVVREYYTVHGFVTFPHKADECSRRAFAEALPDLVGH